MTGKSILVKRLLCTALALFLLLTAAIPAFAEPTALSEYAVLVDSTTGQVLYSKGMDESISPSGLSWIPFIFILISFFIVLQSNLIFSPTTLPFKHYGVKLNRHELKQPI